MSEEELQQNWIVFIATLGSRPQVVTAAIDLLWNQGVKLDRVVVIHTISSNLKLKLSLDIVRKALPKYPWLLDAEFIPFMDQDANQLSDVATPEEAQAAFSTLYRVLHNHKKNNYQIHLSIAGGRKTMAVFGMAAAQLLFDNNDHLWHLHSTPSFLESKHLHPNLEKDQAHLISIPVIQWSTISPILLDLKRSSDPLEALNTQKKLRWTEKLDKSQTFVRDVLSPDEEQVVQELVTSGLSNQEISEGLNLEPDAVEVFIRSALKKAADFWMKGKVDKTVLIALLNLYYSTQTAGKSKFSDN